MPHPTIDTIHYHPYELPPAQRPAPAKVKRGRNKEIVYFETGTFEEQRESEAIKGQIF